MPKRTYAIAAAVVLLGAFSAAPISADQDPAISHLRGIADRPDVIAALGSYDILSMAPAGGYSEAWEQDLLRVQRDFQSEVFGQ